MTITDPHPGTTAPTSGPLRVGCEPAVRATTAEVVASLPVSFAAAAEEAGTTGPLDVLAVDGGPGWTVRARDALERARAVVVLDPAPVQPAAVDALADAVEAAGTVLHLSETFAGNPALAQLRSSRPDALEGAGSLFLDSTSPGASTPGLLLAQLRVLRATVGPVTALRSCSPHPGGLTLTATAGDRLVVGVAARSTATPPHLRVTAVAADRTVDVALPAAATARPASVEITGVDGRSVLPTLYETAHRATWRAVHRDLTSGTAGSDAAAAPVATLRDFAQDLRTVAGAGLALPDEEGFVPLFDGVSLAGWHPAPRVYGTLHPGGPHLHDVLRERGLSVPVDPELHPAAWSVHTDERGETFVVGEQGTPGYGGYLVSDATFGDFELVIEVKPDWPADTGIMLRRRRDSWEGFQVLLDHRPSGGIGGFFGNGIGSFHVLPFAVDAELDADGTVARLVPDDLATSAEPVTQDKIDRLSYAADVEDFLAVWRVGDWNTMRIRCVGAEPVITTWVNDVRIAELDTATLQAPDYDADAVHAVLGDRGHLALEVHDNDEMFGDARWGAGARCRWRNARLKELGSSR
ncbi:DUF1080 domain-containing protein [Kineococcus sp. TBRC 1896]|uniref:DUF1080 domain-containing protein n=1 Tax=Kineococcus mangrovi TaxID=1660183 RepID=A0ABV4I3X8_9ACTN